MGMADPAWEYVVIAMMIRLVQFFWILLGLPATKPKPFASRT
jgi:hypothetical protein